MNKKNLLLITLMLVSTASAMKRKAERHRCEPYEKRNEIISFTSLHGFPLTSLDNGQKWAAKLSKEELQKVRKQIKWQKDKRFTALLHMVTLPLETKRLIVAYVLKEKSYENATNMFCRMPLCDALNQYALSMNIYQDPRKYSVKPNSLPLHVIFEYARDIKVNHEIKERQCNMCSKKELESVARVMDMFGKYVGSYCCRYQFYDQPVMTAKNFIKQCNRDQFCLLSVFLATYVLSTFPDGCDKCEFNQELSLVDQKPGCKPFWGSRVKWADAYGCLVNDFGACKFLAVTVMVSALVYYMDRYHEHWKRSSIEIRQRDALRFFRALLGFYAWSVCIGWKASFSMLLYIVSSYFSEGPFVGTGCMALLYGLLCSGYNLHKMHRLQEGYVWRQNIPALLQRTDIEIV